MDKEDKILLETITKAIQDKMGHKIIVADLTSIKNVICKYFVICQGNSNIQVDAIAGSVSDTTREKLGTKAIGVTGLENCIWVVIDYGSIMVHIFQPEAREFYDLEHLWEDANLNEVPEDF